MFPNYYVREHLTHGYALTVHSAQGVTADTTHAVIGENAERRLLYVAMTSGRQTNTAHLYQRMGEDYGYRRTPVAPSVRTRDTGFDAGELVRSVVDRDHPVITAHTSAAQIADSELPLSVQARSAQRADAADRRIRDYEVWRAERQTFVRDTGLAHRERLRQAHLHIADDGFEL